MMRSVIFAMQTKQTQEPAAIENILLLALTITAFAGLALQFGINWHALSAGIHSKLHLVQLNLN